MWTSGPRLFPCRYFDLMPWTDTDPMTERAKFVLAADDEAFTMSELCRRFKISRKTGYKWLRRYKAGGLPALADRSRAPNHCPHRTPMAVREAIIEARDERPTWGPRKLRAYLQSRHPEVAWPARSTLYQILKSAGRISSRRRRRRPVHPGTSPLEADRPGAVWTADFKGEFRLACGRYCYPLTIQDACSRYLLACAALPPRRRRRPHRSFSKRFAATGARPRSGPITALPSPVAARWADSPGSTSRGVASASRINAPGPPVRKITGAMSGCIAR